MSNLAIAVTGAPARATCYLTNSMTMNGESQLMPPGRYECDPHRVDGEWLFQNRLVILDAPLALPEI